MSYADLYPVSSPYSRGGHGPVSITVGGVDEETELVSQTPWDEQMEWDVHAHPDDTTRHHIGQASSIEDSGWSDMDWEPGHQQPSQGSSLVVCIDTNALIRHLPLIKLVHNLLITESRTTHSPSPIIFLVPTVVVVELDSLKTSPKPVHSSSSSSSASIHASTVGRLAQDANRWLLELKRKERMDDVQSGVLFVRSPSHPSLLSNDDRILQTALDFRSTLASSSTGVVPQVVLWTGDVNLSIKAEAEGIATFGSGDRTVPRTPIGLLQMLGVAPKEPVPVPRIFPHPRHQHHHAASSRPAYQSAGDGMEVDVGAMDEHRGVADFSARDSFGRVLSECVPTALDRHLTHIRTINPSILDNAGLPADPPPRTWRLDQCFDALARIWGNDKGRWEGRDLGTFVDRRQATNPPPPPRSNISVHARPSVHTPSPATAVFHPPSPKHVREVLLPTLSGFFSLERVMPSEDEWVEALKAVEIVLCGPGGRRFLGPRDWEDLKMEVDRGWQEVELVRRREQGWDD